MKKVEKREKHVLDFHFHFYTTHLSQSRNSYFLYHQIHPGSKVNPELFAQHLLWLSKRGYHTMTLSEYIEEGLPKNGIVNFG